MTQSSIQQNKTSLNKEKVCLECNNPSDFLDNPINNTNLCQKCIKRILTYSF